MCVPTSMLLERFRSWSCVYRMGREGGREGGRGCRGGKGVEREEDGVGQKEGGGVWG